VKTLRKKKGWTQQMAAEKCREIGWNLSRGGYSKIEAGLRRVIDVELLLLSRVLDVPVQKLFEAEKIDGAVPEAKILEVARHGG